jgi:F0F1-type ATP synthase membrane subunit b/b'
MTTQAFVHQLETRRESSRQQAEAILNRARADGRDTLTELEQREVDSLIGDMRALSERIADETCPL